MICICIHVQLMTHLAWKIRRSGQVCLVFFFYSSTDSWQYSGSSFNRNYVAEIINMAIETMLHPMYFLLYLNECYLLVLIYI